MIANTMTPADLDLARFAGLELLETPLIIIRLSGQIVYANPACESLLNLSQRELLRHRLPQLFCQSEQLLQALEAACQLNASYIEHDLQLISQYNEASLHLSLSITPLESPECLLLIELRSLDQPLRIANEERQRLQQEAHKELMRNLAHEIKNPLAGIRGASQLLTHELADRPELIEYTQVITGEALRLQSLLDRMLAPHRRPVPVEVNIHQVLERVRSIVLSAYPHSLTIERDYDVSLPTLRADNEQLIQVALNIANNAAQALNGQGLIILRTRVARQATIARKRHALALKLQIIDNGPGIPEALREHVFFPLVTGRAEGTGLGLTLAQAFVYQQGGSIEFESRPGLTCFTIMLPYAADEPPG